jgi:glycosyltransferase involved in cell wall biosynthesis
VDDGKRVLIISPVRNEAKHIDTVAASIERQTRPPDAWLVIDDGSTDSTPAQLAAIAQRIPYARSLSTPAGFTIDSGDRHTAAAAPRAFNHALATVDWRDFTHIGKLDADIELPGDYFERLLAKFDGDPSLGIGGGVLIERVGADWETMHTAPHHVRGALKLYRRECFDAIGGVRELLGWDGIDQTYARMYGYSTRCFDDLVARHHRACGSADGLLRGRIRGGATHYVLGFSAPWVLAKSLKFARMRPRGISGAAFLYGYLRALWHSAPRIEDAAYRRFVRADERRRLAQSLARRKVALTGGVSRQMLRDDRS